MIGGNRGNDEKERRERVGDNHILRHAIADAPITFSGTKAALEAKEERGLLKGKHRYLL